MARYDAQINLLVSGQRELDRLADRLRSIEKQIVDINMLGVKPQQRDPVTGRFGADPDRQNRIQLARIQRIGREEERRSRLTSARVREQNSELERSILLQSRLNSAVDLYERKLEELSRGGGGAKLSESLKGQIKDIQAAYDAATAGGTKNLSIVRSLATELGRVVERQNEINRLSSFQSKSFFDAQRFERRIAELRRAGASASAFGGVGSQIRELRSAQARGSEFEAKDASRRIKESLDRIARELDGTIRQAKIENTARKAARSWEKFFEDAGANSLRLRQNQKDASVKLKNFFEDAATQALQISQNAKETRRSWQSFFDDAATQAFQISQNAKNTKQSWQSFFEGAANQALQISQNAKDTRRSWQEFFEDAQREADRLREGRLSRFARLRGRPDQYGEEAGPLPPGGPGAPRYFQEARQLSSQLLDVEAEIGRIRQESLNESLRLETKRLSLAKEYKRQVADALLEAVTFGKGSQVKRVAKDIATGGQNALVRGGLGLGALGISGAYVGAQEALSNLNFGPLQGQAVKAADAIGNAINSSLGGIPEIVNQMLSALGNIPSSLGLATVAALAFAPAMKTAGEAVFLAGKKFGQTKFGENVKLTLNRQTNLFESAINAASQMTMPIDASGFERNLEVRQSGKETADSWRSFFEEAAYLGLQLKQDSKDTATKWSDFFKDASYQALQISQNSKNTRKSWQAFFEDAAYEAFSIRQGSKDTASSWKLFFENAAYEAFFIRQNSKKTAEAWRSFFEEAAYEALSIRQKSKETAEAWGVFFADAAAQALEIKQNLKKTAESWRTFFLDAASETLRVSQEAKNTANNWKSFFENAAYQALQIKQNSRETSESWKVFFEDAAYEAFSIKEKAKLTRSSWERFFEDAELEAERLRGGSQTGLQSSLKRLEEARGAQQAFFGKASPSEEINKILTEASIKLRNPASATTVELEALSNTLKSFRGVLDPTVEGFERLEKQLRETAANLDRQLERRAPDAGFLTRQFGPRTARGLSEGLIGGAFPLLFGQGIGASIGGAAGGFGGGFLGGGLGFGLSLVGTAAGTALDTAIQSAKDLGAALEKPVENFEQLAQQAFFSSKALESTIKKTIEYGDTATASALIQEEAIKKLGVDGVRNLQELASESDQLGRALGELGQNMLAVIAGPLAKFTAALNRFFEPKVQAQRVENLRAGLAPQQREALNKELLSIGGPGSARYGAQQKLSEQGRGLNLPEIELAAKQAPEKIQAILDKYAPFIVKSEVKLDSKQKIESEINALQKKLEAMDIGKSLLDQVRSANREQEDLDKQRAELVRSYEESIGNIRKQVEDRIADERRKNAQLELDIRAAAADLQLEKIKEANREFRGIFLDTLAGQTTERILDAVETITQIQNDGASQRANLELQIQNTAIETEKYKVEIANQVAKLNEETARRIDDINLSVRRRNEEYDQNRFTLEKRIAELQLKNNEILTTQQLDTAKKQLEAAKKAGDTQQQAYAKTFVDIYQSQLDIVQKGQQEVGAISAPSKLKGVPAGVVGGGSVGTSGIDQAVNAGIRLQQALQGVQDQIRSVNSAGALTNIEESLEKQIKQAELLFFEFEMGGGARSKDLAAQGNLIDAINAKLAEQQDKMSPLSKKLRELLQFENGRFKIINLINEATAADVQVKTLEDLIGKENELKILIEEAKRGSQGLSEVDRTRLILQQAGLDIENEKVRAIFAQAAAVDALNEKYKKLTADQQMQKELLDGIANTFAGTVSNAIDAAVDGTQNFGEALKGLAADMLRTIGKMLIMYAIAQALGALGGGADNPQGIFSFLARGFGFRESAKGSYFANGIAAFAKGGMFTNSVVSSPTLFQFADGGVTRMGLMGEAGPEAIMPLKRGPDGRLGVAAHFSENRQAMKGGSSGEPDSAFSENRGAINAAAAVERERMLERLISSGASSTEIKYSRVGSGDLPFVTEEDMLQASRIAAQEGARLGQQRTLAALKNNPAARRSIGI